MEPAEEGWEALMELTASAFRFQLRLPKRMWCPSPQRPRATSRPMPELAPVMTMFLPDILGVRLSESYKLIKKWTDQYCNYQKTQTQCMMITGQNLPKLSMTSISEQIQSLITGLISLFIKQYNLSGMQSMQSGQYILNKHKTLEEAQKQSDQGEWHLSNHTLEIDSAAMRFSFKHLYHTKRLKGTYVPADTYDYKKVETEFEGPLKQQGHNRLIAVVEKFCSTAFLTQQSESLDMFTTVCEGHMTLLVDETTLKVEEVSIKVNSMGLNYEEIGLISENMLFQKQ